jgi:hypothetical protein
LILATKCMACGKTRVGCTRHDRCQECVNAGREAPRRSDHAIRDKHRWLATFEAAARYELEAAQVESCRPAFERLAAITDEHRPLRRKNE